MRTVITGCHDARPRSFPLAAAALATAILAGLSQRAWRTFGAGNGLPSGPGPASEGPDARLEPADRT